MKKATKVIAILLAMLLTIGLLTITALTASGAITIGEFENHKNNSQNNRYTISKNASGQTVASYNTKTSWDCLTASVSGYTAASASEYTRLCITAKFVGTKQLAVELPYPGLSGNLELLWSEFQNSSIMTHNADGSYTFDIPLSSYAKIKTDGISSIYIFLDPNVSVSSTRSMTIIDIGFRKAGEPAIVEPGGSPPVSYTVTVNGSYASPTGAGSYTQGETVTISAGTRLGYTFAGWTTSTSGVSFASTSSETTTFAMPGKNAAVTANWAAIPKYKLTVKDSYASATGAGNYAQGETVTINAGTRLGYTFTGWTTSTAGVSFASINSATTTFVMPERAATVTAKWATNYTVTVNGSYASPTGAGSYIQGDTVTINAGTRLGYAFAGWTTSTSGVSFASTGSATTAFVMPGKNAAVTANWAPVNYMVTVIGSYATPSGAGSYGQGATVPINAGTRPGYAFSEWIASVPDVILTNTNSATTTFMMPASDVTVTAVWTVIPPVTPTYYVAANGNDSGNGSFATPWKTISASVGKLKAGDTLIILEGRYYEKLTIGVSGTADKYITIMGEPGKRVYLDGTGLTSGNYMVYMNNKSYVRIENLEICNNQSSGATMGIYVEASDSSVGIQLVNNKIYNINGETGSSLNGDGISARASGTSPNGAIRDLLIEGNEVYDCKLGHSEAVVVNGNITDWKIINNYIHDNDNIGIDAAGGFKACKTASLDQARNGLIAGNVVVNNNGTDNPTYEGNGGADGIYVDGGRDIVIEYNYVSGSAYGIEIGTENSLSDFGPKNIVIRHNVSLGNDNAAIQLGGTNGSNNILVERNTMYQADGRCFRTNQGPGPYTIRYNISIATASGSYVKEYGGTLVYSNNIYYGKTSGKPVGDPGSPIVTTLPVIDLICFEPTVNAGAELSIESTPFIERVVTCPHIN